MKKLFTLLLLALLPFSSMSLQAQSIVGVWRCVKDGMTYYYFIEQNKYKFKMATIMNDKEYGFHHVTLEVSGTYTYNGKVFSGQYKKEDVKIDAELLSPPKDSDNTDMLEYLMSLKAEALWHSFFSKPINVERWEVASLTDSTMILSSGDTYTRMNNSGLTGTWNTVYKNNLFVEHLGGREGEGDVWTYDITFGQNTILKGVGEVYFDDALATVRLTEPLIYNISGDVFEIEPLVDQAEISLDKVEWSSEILKKIDEDPQLEKKYYENCKSLIQKKMKKTLASGIPFNGLLFIMPQGDDPDDDVMVLKTVFEGIMTLIRVDPALQTTTETDVSKSEADMQPVDTSVHDEVDVMPGFPGGTNGLMQYLAKNLKYPLVCEENGIEGRVTVSFIVEKDGSVSDVNVVKSVNPALDKEAKRLVNSMPKWSPGKIGGKPVRVKYSIPVNFRLK